MGQGLHQLTMSSEGGQHSCMGRWTFTFCTRRGGDRMILREGVEGWNGGGGERSNEQNFVVTDQIMYHTLLYRIMRVSYSHDFILRFLYVTRYTE